MYERHYNVLLMSRNQVVGHIRAAFATLRVPNRDPALRVV